MKKSDGSFILVSVAHCCCRYRGIATEIIIKGERTLLMPCVLPLRIENREELKIQDTGTTTRNYSGTSSSGTHCTT